MKFDLFISDYDGTLGNAPANDIDAETLASIKEYQKRGGKFVVCSGREYRSIKQILDNSNLKGLVVCFQGALIADLESGEVLFEGGIAEDFAREKEIGEVTKESFYGHEFTVITLK